MTIFMFSFTTTGAKLSLKLHQLYTNLGYDCTSYTLDKFTFSKPLIALSKPLNQQVKECFTKGNALVFIGACGIAVRSIAPYLKDKTSDPCVVVLDEQGQYAISLLSGHLGGGNDFTTKTAKLIHATPIITTATDLNHTFSVDNFAKKNQLELSDMTLAKEISSLLLQNKKVGFDSKYAISESIPKGLITLSEMNNDISTGISITYTIPKNAPFRKTLYLIPKQVILGIGCKKNTSCKKIEHLVFKTLDQYHIPLSALHSISSIDLKNEEAGLLEFCEIYHLPFTTYSSTQLQQVQGSFSSSAFVKEITGVDNICERAALLSAKTHQLCFPKTAEQGVTVAGALLPITISF